MLSSKKLRNKLPSKAIYVFAIFIALLVPLFSSTTLYAYGSKVSTSGANPINEGSSEVINFSLSQPIICGGTNPCEVDLDLSSSDPTNISFSTNPIVWTSTQWAQTMTTTINTINNGTYNTGETATITATVVSNAAYYNGYTLNFPITINNINPPLAPSISNQNVSLNKNMTTSLDVINGISGNPDPSTLTIVTSPTHGTAVISSNNILYTPNMNYVGSDSLVYSVCSQLDDSVCSTATLSFYVSATSNLLTTATNPLTPDTGFGTPNQNPFFYTLIVPGSMVVVALILLLAFKRTKKTR